ncbi:hypothetical protein BT63DRAFT_484354 [Microthyrium microscopicum]|uniref:CFEM domain-containing protein n=1 Tax=Microthyrium microscopicum TaxID=703497 RepID=A0A6A6TVR1_9PEZI|nr:hypothetical protein BT63DRAFT_484354 [Microthyrium microscopicum]
MKFFAILALASVAFAVDLSSLPTCSLTCFAQGAAVAGCNLNDVVCQCTTGKNALTASVTPCVDKACSAADQAATVSASLSICAAAISGSNTTTTSTTPSAVPKTTTNSASINVAGSFVAGAGLFAAWLL